MSASKPIYLNETNIDGWVDIISLFIQENNILDLNSFLNENGSNGEGVWFRLAILLYGTHSSELEQRLKVCWFTDQFNLHERVERNLIKLGFFTKQSKFFN